ncbi:MAG: RNA polymerase sigma factor [Actinomycetota bacterium]
MDRATIEAAQRGEDWALEEIYRELAPAVGGYLRGQGVRDSEDATSEVFVGVMRGLERFRGDERDFRTWVFSIAHRRLIDDRRRLARRKETSMDPADLAGPLESSVVGDAEIEALEGLSTSWALGALSSLSPDQRAVVLLRVLADLSVEQVAAILGKSPGAVKALQRRGLIALSRSLDMEGVS